MLIILEVGRDGCGCRSWGGAAHHYKNGEDDDQYFPGYCFHFAPQPIVIIIGSVNTNPNHEIKNGGHTR
jgi:hypothetical protein